MRAARGSMAIALLGCCRVAGFTFSSSISPGLVRRAISSESILIQPAPTRNYRGEKKQVIVVKASEGESEDMLGNYRLQMADFMVQSHEKRLEAMDAVKAEVQRGFEEQIAELRAQLAALPLPSPAPVPAAMPAPRRTEELAIVGASSGATTQVTRSDTVHLHPAYAARSGRPGWEARWGPEEVERAAAVSPTVNAPQSASPPAGSSSQAVHPTYAARLQRPGWDARWGDEEVARVNAIPTGTQPATDLPYLPDNVHPAYSARLQRSGWEARWGAEEPERVASAAAGAVAVEGAAAGVATAGGLEATATEGVAGEEDASMDDLFLGWCLPDGVTDLKEMVISSRRHFQDYLIRSLEANKELRASKTALEKDLASTKAALAKEQELHGTMQASSRPEDTSGTSTSAGGNADEAELEKQVALLTGEVAQLQHFAQTYMVKAASEKLKAVEEAKASAREESSERLATLQAQILALQAQG